MFWMKCSYPDTDFEIVKKNILSEWYELKVSGKGRKLSDVSENMLSDSNKFPVCLLHLHLLCQHPLWWRWSPLTLLAGLMLTPSEVWALAGLVLSRDSLGL
jgi:hypothetical protein